jgi:hypothetical protein
MAIFYSGILLDLVFLDTSCGLRNKRPDGVGEIVAVARFTRTNAGRNWLYLPHPRQGYQRQYWSRIVDSRRIGAKWCAIVFLFVPVLMAIAVLLDVASGGNETLGRVDGFDQDEGECERHE